MVQKKRSSLQINCRKLVQSSLKLFFYVTDSNSHNLLTGECAIELYLICLHHKTSDKRDDSAKLQEMYVANEKKCNGK